MSGEPSPLDNKIISLAQARTPSAQELRAFSPTPSHEAVAAALNETSPRTVEELAETAGVSTKTVARVLNDPAALTWTVAQASRLAEARLGAVHTRLLEIALTAKPSQALPAIRLFLDRFDPEHKKQQVLEKGQNTFQFQNYDTSELANWVQRKARQLQGSAAGPSPTDSGVRRLPGPDPEGPGGVPSRDA